MALFEIIGLITFCFVLIKATALIVESLKYLSIKSKLGIYGLTAFLLAVATSLPELVVGVVASLEGNSQIVLGNVVGSNIADISLVIGGAALVGGMVKVGGVILKRDIYLTFGAGILPILLLADGILSREDGLVLLTLYLIFVFTFLRPHQQALSKHALSKNRLHFLLNMVTSGQGKSNLIRFFLGILLLLISSHLIVKLATGLSLSLGLPVLFIGLFVVAIGTSLPELAFEMKAVLSGQSQMALGDLLGSIVANSTLILGLSSLIRPITLDHYKLLPYAVSIFAFVIIYFLFAYFVHTKKKLERWEGFLLIIIYLGFIFFELTK